MLEKIYTSVGASDNIYQVDRFGYYLPTGIIKN